MKTIALLIPGMEKTGGAERQVHLLARGLAQRGWHVHLVCMSGSTAAVQKSLPGVQCVGLGMRHGLKDPLGWLRFFQWLRKTRPQILHAHLPHAAWMARWSRFFVPIRVVVDTIHTTATGGWANRSGYRISNWLTDRVSVVSAAVAARWLARDLIESSKLRIIPNGVELAAADHAQKCSSESKNGFLWLAAGRLEPVKDHTTLLKAFALVNEKARLLIAGDGPLRCSLQLLAEQLGVSGRVQWAGFVDDLSRLYARADGLVLTSLWEGLPMSILEAASHRLPIVATDVPGVREALPQSSHPWLAPAGNDHELAIRMNAMMELTEDSRHQIGEDHFNFVANHFSIERVLDQWEREYEQLLSAHPHPRQRA